MIALPAAVLDPNLALPESGDPEPSGEQGGVSELAERVYYAIAAYAFGEAGCWPSQQRIAWDLGIARETVNRKVRELRDAGWLRIIERRWSWRTFWPYNVYELLHDYAGKVSEQDVKRIVGRAHNTLRKRAARLAERLAQRRVSRLDHTNTYGMARVGLGWCGCWACRPEEHYLRARPAPP